MSRTRAWAACLVSVVGCGASSTPTTVGPTTDESSTGDEVRGETANAPTSAFVIGSVSWEMSQPIRIDDRGDVFHGSQRVGVLTANGELIDEDGSVTARLAPDGTIQVGDRVSSMRLVGAGVVERDSPLMQIEGSELLVGEGDELERLPLTGFRPELTREVLFVSAVVMEAMARAYAH